jgi:hypothetical protein
VTHRGFVPAGAPGLGTLVRASRPAIGASSVGRGPGRRPVRYRPLCQFASSYRLCASVEFEGLGARAA